MSKQRKIDDSVRGKFLTPTGKELAGTLEAFDWAVALTTGVSREIDGTFEPGYEGTTDIDWNTQHTVYEDGQRVWVDEDNRLWREHELVFVPDEELEAAPDKAPGV